MSWTQVLQAAANVASIATALVAVWAYHRYSKNRRDKQKRLENYLRAEKEVGNDQGMRTLMHLVAQLGMTDTEILDAAFKSKHVIRRVTTDESGIASRLLLEYSAKKIVGDKSMGVFGR